MRTFLLLLASVVGQSEPTYRYVPVSPAQPPGVGLWAWRTSGTVIPIATDVFAFRDLTKYTAALDHPGLKELVDGRRLMFLKPGTAVRVLQFDRGVLTVAPAYEVRVLDGSHVDKAGWVPAAYLWDRVEVQAKAKRGVTKTDPATKPKTDAPTLLKMARNMEKANMGAARKYYQELLNRFPDSPEATTARDRLKVLDAPAP